MKHLSIVALLIATLYLIPSITTVESTTILASPAPSPPTSTSGDCDGKCAIRCSRSGYKERCLKYCGICCDKCKGCVPSGPYVDKAQCPCYRDMKNPKGGDKCP